MSAPPALARGRNLGDLSDTAAARVSLGASPRAYSTMDPKFGAYGDTQQFWAVLAITSGTAALNVGGTATATLTNCTINFGAHTLTTAASLFSPGPKLGGTPISITGAGAGGATLATKIVTAVTSGGGVVAGLDDPCANASGLSASPQTVTLGAYFSSAADAAAVPKKIVVPGAGAAGAALVATIAGVTDANNITLGSNASTTLQAASLNNWNLLTWGHDDSVAVNAAIAAAVARGDRYLYVPNKHYVPTLSALISYLIPYGEGALIGAPYQVNVVPFGAPQASPPPLDTDPATHMTAFQSALNPVVVTAGDSLWQLEAGNNNDPAIAMQIEPALFSRLRRQNPTKSITFYDRSIGAQTYANLDSTPSIFPSWYTNHASTWISYVLALNPDAVVLGFGNNEVANLSVSAFLDVQSQIDAAAKVPDRMIAAHWTKSPLNSAATPSGCDYVAMFVRTYAKMRGFAPLDFNRQGNKAQFGFDPCAMALVDTQAFNDYANARLSLPFTAPSGALTTGYEVRVQDVTGQSGASFWAHYGNEIQFGLSGAAGNVFRVGYDISADSSGRTGSLGLYYQCDISAAYPGAGCKGGTVPSILAHFSITSGANSLSADVPIFKAADDGQWITVPGAVTGSYLVAYMHYVDSTHVTLFSDAGLTTPRNATATLTASSQVILRGNPKIQTGIVVSGDVTNSTRISFSVRGGKVAATYQSLDGNLFFSDTAVRFGGSFLPTITATTSFPLGLGTFGDINAVFFIEKPFLNWPSMTSLEMNGPDTNAPIGNAAYVGKYGGGGDNHPPSLATSKIIDPVIEAQDFCAAKNPALPTSVVTPVTGFTAAIPDYCRAYQMTPAGTLATGTLTLPVNFPQNTPLVIASTQTITALTLSAPSGFTVNGAPTTLAANGAVSFVLNGTTWYRRQ